MSDREQIRAAAGSGLDNSTNGRARWTRHCDNHWYPERLSGAVRLGVWSGRDGSQRRSTEVTEGHPELRPGLTKLPTVCLPDEVGQEQHQRKRGPAPEPGSAEVASCRRQEHSDYQAHRQEGHSVFGHHSEADDGPDGEPPVGIEAYPSTRLKPRAPSTSIR